MGNGWGWGRTRAIHRRGRGSVMHRAGVVECDPFSLEMEKMRPGVVK